MTDHAADCIYPACQIPTEFGKACEHSCEHEARAKRVKPYGRDCLAADIPGATCQFPKCDC